MKSVIIAAVFLFACANASYADIIHKKDGEKIEGTLTGAVYEGQVGIQTANKMFYVLQSDIEKIEYSEKAPADEGINWGVILTITGSCLLAFLLLMAGRSI